MKTLQNFFDGYKTYIMGAAILATAFLEAYGFIPAQVAQLLYAIEGGGGLIALRATLSKVQNALPRD